VTEGLCFLSAVCVSQRDVIDKDVSVTVLIVRKGQHASDFKFVGTRGRDSERRQVPIKKERQVPIKKGRQVTLS
jgi:hypothetical protein